MKPERWNDPSKKIFPHQVGFTAPPHDFDAAPHDFTRIAPEGVGVHGKLIHVAEYAHTLSQRVDNFNKLEEVVHCMSNAGADVVGQVGTNWSHAGGKTPSDIRGFCDRMADTYQVPLHMAGMSLVEALKDIGAKSIAVNGGYFWPDWREGTTRFWQRAGLMSCTRGTLLIRDLSPPNKKSTRQRGFFQATLRGARLSLSPNKHRRQTP